MLRFFRTIRQRLLTDNKVSKYLLYASGSFLFPTEVFIQQYQYIKNSG